MLWQQLLEMIAQRLAEYPDVADDIALNTLRDSDRPILYVDSEQQLLAYVKRQSTVIQYYPVSTSRYGLGQHQGSFQTPVGLHRIAQKIGDGEPPGRVFKARIPTELQCFPGDESVEEDVITSRILWLEGLEPDINQGAEVDSFQRYIYIHGTSDEAHIGQPASIGCIRMKNVDVIELFAQVAQGDLVVIS